MGLAIIFRPQPLVPGAFPNNPFNEVVIGSIGALGQQPEVLISSGFFQEAAPGVAGTYNASEEPLFKQNLSITNANLILVGIYSSGIWMNRYMSFGTKIAAGPVNPVNTFGFRAANFWHAKTFTALDGLGNPIIAVIGSSNITTRAFGTTPGNLSKTNNDFNIECDVVM